MKEIQALTKVHEFHEKFNHLIKNTPTLSAFKIAQLRINLLKEELGELIVALNNKDIVEAADALMDLQYVLSGAIISLGLGSIASELFDEVHRSNMSKLCNNLDDLFKTLDKYGDRDNSNYEVIGEGTDKKYHAFRTSDRKTLKSINYSPANLAPIIALAQNTLGCHLEEKQNSFICPCPEKLCIECKPLKL